MDFHSIFITGGTGFIGRNLVDRMASTGCSMHILVRPDSNRSCFLAQKNVFLHTYDGTVDSVTKAVDESRPDAAFHLATCYHAHHLSDQLEEMIQANITLGIHVLEAITAANVGVLVNAGSAWQNYRDEDYCPVNLYAAMKQAFEDLLAYYVDAHGVRAITLRLFDTYGPGDTRRKLLPALLKSVREGDAIDMVSGEQKLDLVHIDDVVEAFLRAALYAREMPSSNHKVFALSSGEQHTIKNIVDLLSKFAGSNINVNWGALTNRRRDVIEPWTKGKRLPNWKLTVSLEEGLARLLEQGE